MFLVYIAVKKFPDKNTAKRLTIIDLVFKYTVINIFKYNFCNNSAGIAANCHLYSSKLINEIT